MSYYAEIKDGVVAQVLVMDDALTDEEAIAWLQANVSANLWVRTDPNGDFRNKYAGIGDEYKADTDDFVAAKPFESWVYDENRKMYIPDIPKPIAVIVGYVWVYYEHLKAWVSKKIGSA